MNPRSLTLVKKQFTCKIDVMFSANNKKLVISVTKFC